MINCLRKSNNLKAFILYAVMAFLANWSIILGTNHMKYDIWDAHYPMHVIVSDAIHSGTFPIWNPLYNFGTPYYAMIGTPVFYPFTLFFDVIGYTPKSPGCEYWLHLVIAAMGMYLLAKNVLKAKAEGSFTSNGACLLAGLAYAFSGIFFSNAEHIMIVISAAWIPYVLLFSKKFIESKNILNIFFTAMSLSMIVLGGYPEMLYDTVLVLLLWLIINHDSSYSISRKIVSSIKAYAAIGVLTVIASAVTLIPFLHIMPQITRGEGQSVMSNSLTSIFTMIFPQASDQLLGDEISMQSMYINLFVIIGIIFILLKTNGYIKEKMMLVLALVSMTLCFGNNSFADMLLYRFMPAYSTFRFAPLWRPFFFIFLILAVVSVWDDFVFSAPNAELVAKMRDLVKVLAIITLATYVFSLTVKNEEIINKLNLICTALVILSFFCFVYYVFFTISPSVTKKNRSTLLVAMVAFECMCVANLYFPSTVATFGQTEYYSNIEAKSNVDNEFEIFNGRNINCDFANNGRSDSGLCSKDIALNKTFDTNGYLSIKLKTVDDYKNTYNYNLTANNPEVYFTNDITVVEDDAMENWLSDQSLVASSIAVSDDYNLNINSNREFNQVLVNHFGFNSLSFSYDAKSDGIVTILQAYYPGWKLYVDGKPADIAKVDGCFMGVPLKKGHHDVVMKFRPMDLYIGAVLTILFYISFVGVIVGRKKK